MSYKMIEKKLDAHSLTSLATPYSYCLLFDFLFVYYNVYFLTTQVKLKSSVHQFLCSSLTEFSEKKAMLHMHISKKK